MGKQELSVNNSISQKERRAQGKALRSVLPRKDQALWKPLPNRRDPVEILNETNNGRIADLIPIRHGRMMASPFAFYRGAAAIMAADLSTLPVTGVRVQSCGDCHLMNFGAYATPERNLVLDINDFDETLPAPWEWDLKRLATSFVLACRGRGFKNSVALQAAIHAARAYRLAMHKFSTMRMLDIWYSKKSAESFIAEMSDKKSRNLAMDFVEKVRQKSVADNLVPKLTVEQNGRRVFKDNPPLLFHSDNQRERQFIKSLKDVISDYKNSLTSDRRVLFEHYELHDIAFKVVGIGSVGTACGVGLFMAGDDDPLVLQIKEARASVLAPYVTGCAYKNEAQRVVEGQRLMQAACDIFLGWTAGKAGRHFYIRQLKDMKISLVPERWTAVRALEVGCQLGWVLARAHARSGNAALISGYMGASDMFDKAIGDFAVAYADQTERDYDAFVAAIKAGRLQATGENQSEEAR